MVVSLKDGLKLVSVSIICFCAVYVCTFFLNFYIDAHAIADLVTPEQQPLYDAQLATAQFVCGISGGFLAVIAVVMLVFYIKLFIDEHSRHLGVLKAMGYSDGKLAMRFWVFGLSVFIGVVLGFVAGFATMPTVYEGLTIVGLPKIEIRFNPVLLLLIIAPTVAFSLLACGYAYFALRRPVSEMLRGNKERKIKTEKRKRVREEKERTFLKDTCLKTLGSRKSLAFFVVFACFCFSSMVQMGFSMNDLSSMTMGGIILGIGLVLALTSMIMAITSLVNANIKNISIMKAFGYSMKECALSVLGGYAPFALLGFAVGTGYQYGLLSLMVNVVYKDVGGMPDYGFDVPLFFITLAAFIVLYAAFMLVYTLKMSKISVKEVMLEN